MVTITTKPKDISMVQSPLYFGVLNTTPTTNQVYLDLTMNRGDISTLGSQSDIVEVFNLEFPEETESYLDISNILIKYISVYGNEPFWLQYDVYDFGGTLGYNNITLLVNGYSNDYENNGFDISDLNNRFFTNLGTLNVCTDGTYRLPVYVGRTSTNQNVTTNLGDFDLDSDFGLTLNSDLSDEQFGYVDLGASQSLIGSNWTDGLIFEYNVDSLIASNPTLNKMYVSCCQDGMKLRYLNNLGVFMDYPVINMRVTQTFKKSDFNNQTPVWNTDNNTHLDEIYLSNGDTILQLSTGWVFEDADDMVNEILLSDEVYLIKDNIQYSVNILDNTKKRIDRNFKKQINYDLKLKLSQKIINRIY